MRYIGIDPGASGGFAAIDERGTLGNMAWACPMPKSDAGILAVIDKLTDNGTRQVRVMLEHVWTSPQMGVVSAGSFMRQFGALQMALTARGVEFDLVAPVKWQKAMGVLTPKERRAELGHKDKNINKRAAEYMLARGAYTNIQVTHAIADALLLAAYCRNVCGAQLPFPSAKDTTTNGKARRTTQGKARGRVKGQEERPSGTAA
jgi:hypothetical protein